MQIQTPTSGFDLVLDGRLILRHRSDAPCLFVGQGDARMDMYRGNFDIEDYVIERTPLAHAVVSGTEIAFSVAPDQPVRVMLNVSGDGQNAVVAFHSADPSINRVWLRVKADKDEHVWGGGEQMSYFDMRGRRFPLWTSEPGVGRDKSTEITFKADVSGKSGGDYWNTNYPQPTFLSSRRYALHVETTAYSAFDFRRADFHELEVWAVPDRIELTARPTFISLVESTSVPIPSSDWKPSSRPARRCPACGARIGWACATPPSGRACSGIGRRMKTVIRACANASLSWKTAVSISSAT
jgi:alpha-glucosidase